MLSNYIFVYTLISTKNFKIVSPATFVNKSDTRYSVDVVVSDEHQQHLRSRLKYV